MSDTAHAYNYHYTHIPSLQELLPTTGGIPGVQYLQCSLNNLRRAQDDGWGKISGRQMVYTVEGPDGTAHCELYARGKPIPGMSSDSGARRCFLDKDIRKLTGIGKPSAAVKKVIKPAKAPEAAQVGA